jgi:hypothetical protein
LQVNSPGAPVTPLGGPVEYAQAVTVRNMNKEIVTARRVDILRLPYNSTSDLSAHNRMQYNILHETQLNWHAETCGK